MIKYKIIAADLDGTLLNSKSQLSPENIRAINALIEKGVSFVPCTGRTYSEIPKEMTDIHGIRYFIHSNGASVLDRKTGLSVNSSISNETVKKIMDRLLSCESHISVRRSGELLVDSKFQSDRDYEYYNVIPEHVQCIRSSAKMPDNFSEFIYAANDVVVISVFFRNYSDKAACREYFEQLGELLIVEVSEFNLEIFSTDAGKGNALYKLAGMLGIDMSETIGIGDSDNDRS